MSDLNLFAAAPEIVLAVSTMLILVVDLFVDDARRNITYVLSLAALVAVAAICGMFLARDAVLYAFEGLYVADPMGNVLKMFAALATGLALVYAQGYARDRGMWRGELFVLALFVLLGVMVMISANSLLLVYLGLELQALALYALVALRRDDARATEAAMKYFVLGALASGFLLYGMSMLYGAAGTLDINELARNIGTGRVASRAALVLGTVFIVAGLAFKLGAVPFHMWLPDVYHGAPTPVTLLIGSAPTIGQMGFMLLAMFSGVVGGSAMTAANAWSAAMFYVITYAITTLGSFGIILLLARQGFEAEEIADLKGLNRRSPWYAFIMLVLMFSLAGIPPTVGFHAKLVVLQALLGGGMGGLGGSTAIWLAVVAVLLSLVAAYYYLRVVKVMYFDEPVDNQPIVAAPDMRVALSVNGISVLVLGIVPQYLLALCAQAMVRALGG
jgi:NADH-quinone oxidoreductase subunit N